MELESKGMSPGAFVEMTFGRTVWPPKVQGWLKAGPASSTIQKCQWSIEKIVSDNGVMLEVTRVNDSYDIIYQAGQTQLHR